MNWIALGAIAEIFGALGVIASLAYLAAQIGQNTKSVRRSAYQELTNHIGDLNTLLVTDRSLTELFIALRPGLDLLEEPDQIRVLAWIGNVFRHYQNAFFQFRDSILSEKQWPVTAAPIPRLLSSQGARDCWERIRDSFDPEFVQYVDARAKKG